MMLLYGSLVLTKYAFDPDQIDPKKNVNTALHYKDMSIKVIYNASVENPIFPGFLHQIHIWTTLYFLHNMFD